MEGDEDIRTVWCGNLPENIPHDIVYELFHQAGPLESLTIPKDRDGRQRNFCFIRYIHTESVPYAIELFQGTALYGRSLSVQPRNKNVQINYNVSEDLAYLLGRTNYVKNSDAYENSPNQSTENILPQFLFAENDPLPQDPYCIPQQFDLNAAALQGHWSSRGASRDNSSKRSYPYRDEKSENRDYDDRSNYNRNKHKYSHRNHPYEDDAKSYSRHRRN